MSVAIAIRPTKLRKARAALGLTQAEAARALGGVRPETVSRWEHKQGSMRMRALHVQTIKYLNDIAELLIDLMPDRTARREFLARPHAQLGNRSPLDVMLKDPPYGLREVWRLLLRVAHGIPA